mgnify:FL=1
MHRSSVTFFLAASLLVSANSSADARVDYLLHCAGCHLPDGSGVPPDMPSLRGDPGRIVSLPQGRDYLLRVPGASQALLDNADLAQVVNYMMTEFNRDSLPADFKPFTEKEVAEARGRVLADPAKLRAELWEQYEARETTLLQ